MTYDSIKKLTLEELEVDYDYDIENFINSIKERMSIGSYINEKYSISFEPIPIDFYNKQLEILENLTYDDIGKYKQISLEEKSIKLDDIINKAPHYNIGNYECIDVMKDIFGKERLKIWCILNAFKYLYRCYYKNGDQDLEKATYYLNYIKNNLLEEK